MDMYILADEVYNPHGSTKWTKVKDLTVEDAIKNFCGKKTFQLCWEDDEGILRSITLATFEDTSNLAQHLTHQIFEELKRRL